MAIDKPLSDPHRDAIWRKVEVADTTNKLQDKDACAGKTPADRNTNWLRIGMCAAAPVIPAMRECGAAQRES
jgi:hypothetical protein